MLANEKIYPRLLLIFDASIFVEQFIFIQKAKKKFNLNIEVIPPVSQAHLFTYYAKSSALIYPSFCESIGMPLIEAKNMSIDVVASNLDFVHDIVNPIETFNPFKPKSISFSLKKYLRNSL